MDESREERRADEKVWLDIAPWFYQAKGSSPLTFFKKLE